MIELLSAGAPRLDRALKEIARKGGVVVLLDGTLVRTRRGTGDKNRPNYSGKHKAHGLVFLVLTGETGNLVWISAAKPGRSSEIITARHNWITTRLRETGLGALAENRIRAVRHRTAPGETCRDHAASAYSWATIQFPMIRLCPICWM
ncbi:transposase family protein [Streptomyces sp. Go40/10]|uniref:transposase family protein n=1 Tax=Streptomyces sp. Go40/10 TaxID=2825844 RepID=UPI001E414CFF|nr:transposase family protein [Streptomyces sp. Go40/10]UFR07056.1 transposase family protein [Streptomyces sp. Go40/10]